MDKRLIAKDNFYRIAKEMTELLKSAQASCGEDDIGAAISYINDIVDHARRARRWLRLQI